LHADADDDLGEITDVILTDHVLPIPQEEIRKGFQIILILILTDFSEMEVLPLILIP